MKFLSFITFSIIIISTFNNCQKANSESFENNSKIKNNIKSDKNNISSSTSDNNLSKLDIEQFDIINNSDAIIENNNDTLLADSSPNSDNQNYDIENFEEETEKNANLAINQNNLDELTKNYPQLQFRTGKIGSGNTLYKLLIKREGMIMQEAKLLVDSFSKSFDLRRLRPDAQYWIGINSDTKKVEVFRYKSSITETYEARLQNNNYIVEKLPIKTTSKLIKAGGKIRDSLIASLLKVGLKGSIAPKFEEAFAFEINFINDQREGDTFKVIAEEQWLEKNFLGYKNVFALEYNGDKTGKKRAYYFRCPDDSCDGFFDDKGSSAKRSILKTPISVVRISSKFNLKRFHPVLHRHKAHLGVDYAAPRGTPVYATADGIITFFGMKGGIGNLVVIRHKNGLESYYGHLSRFAKGIKVGLEVKQKKVIGFVGSTGLSTGPHLHFGIKENGKFIDPLNYKVGPGPKVPSKFRSIFNQSVDRFNKMLDAIN